MIDLDALTDDELLNMHREVSRRAAAIYAVRYEAVRDAHFAAAMALRDTRFRKGLSPHENVIRCAGGRREDAD